MSPVYYTPDGYIDSYWVSSPEAQHPRKLSRRPDVSIVVFDSQAPIGTAEAVYMSAHAEEVPQKDLSIGAPTSFPPVSRSCEGSVRSSFGPRPCSVCIGRPPPSTLYSSEEGLGDVDVHEVSFQQQLAGNGSAWLSLSWTALSVVQQVPSPSTSDRSRVVLPSRSGRASPVTV